MCRYAWMKLVEEPYHWLDDNYKFCWYWFSLQNLLRTLYAPHLYAFEADCKEPNVEQELELEKPQLSDLVAECKEILASVGKLLASYATKVVLDSEVIDKS